MKDRRNSHGGGVVHVSNSEYFNNHNNRVLHDPDKPLPKPNNGHPGLSRQDSEKTIVIPRNSEGMHIYTYAYILYM